MQYVWKVFLWSAEDKVIMEDLSELKNIGHNLLEEYILLDYSHRSHQQRIQYAYKKLSIKTGKNPHFSSMVNRAQVLKAIDALQHMVQKRMKKREFFGIDKIRYAPNLMQIQKRSYPQVV